MKKRIKLFIVFITVSGWMVAAGQEMKTVSGRVLGGIDKLPLPGAVIYNSGGKIAGFAGKDGLFRVDLMDSSTFILAKHEGYKYTRLLLANFAAGGEIVLAEAAAMLQDVVVSTGYQTLPKERATGSFTKVDSATLSLQAGPNIINRLQGVASGLLLENNPNRPALTIRGISSFEGPKQPLIVVDNFPYEGDIGNINPNDVASITLLKDAAAASIWGTRAGNGVIVITTKKGSPNGHMKVSATANTTVMGKPDLFYLPQMSSSDFIDVETLLFNNGFYYENSDDKAALSPAVELLIAKRDGTISPEAADAAIAKLRTADVRNNFGKYFYQKGVNRQYAVNLSGGGNAANYYLSVGYDDNTSQLGAVYHRFTMRTQSVYKPVTGLQLTVALNYTDTRSASGKPGYGDITTIMGNGLYPYAQFVDGTGNALSLIKDYRETFVDTAGRGRLLDWHYYPLTDYRHSTSRLLTTDLLANIGVSYSVARGLDVSVNYNYEKETQSNPELHDAQSYFARNLVNLFTQINNDDGSISYPIPRGGISDLKQASTKINNIRGMLNFNRKWGSHSVTALAGWEVRESRGSSNRFRTYGYDNAILTFAPVDYTGFYTQYNSGYVNSIQDNTAFNATLNRFVSGYTNASYTFRNCYTLSGSVRKDASNLFGVESNQKGVPLYSAGMAYDVSKEPFYHLAWLPYLKGRLTYGFSGTVDPSRSAVTTMGYITDANFTHLTYGNISQIANPKLTWERTKTVNAGVDFGTRKDWLSGSIDYYLKNGLDLFGPQPVDITTGLQRPYLTTNVASMRGHGLEADLQLRPVSKAVVWKMNLLFNYNLSKVKDYFVYADIGDYYVGSPSLTPIPGKAVYSILSYRWGGLNANGDPQGYLSGKPSTDYLAITSDSTHIADLVYSGPSAPPVYGSVLNSVTFRSFTLTANIGYRLGYYFRKTSINYTSLFYGWNGNSDYADRWQQPGDEVHTNVPSVVYPVNNLRDRFYQYSEALVRKADNVRLQFVNLDYLLTKQVWKRLPFENVHVYVYGSNLGILWKANKGKIDPDYPNSLPPATNITFGITLNF